MKKLSIAIAIVAVLSLVSCGTATKTLYSWYDYEDVTYTYSKRQTEELQEKMVEQYLKLIDKQKGTRGVVPPGLYAEYGYIMYKSGEKEQGIDYMKKEVELYPESDKYISRIIKQLEK